MITLMCVCIATGTVAENFDASYIQDTVEEPVEANRSRGTSHTTSYKSRPVSSKAAVATKRKREMRENIEESAMELLQHFNNRNLDAFLRCVRNMLEALRKHITSSSMVHYIGKRCRFYFIFVFLVI